MYSPSSVRPAFFRCAKFSCLVFISILCLWTILSSAFFPETMTSIKISIDRTEDIRTPFDLAWILFIVVFAINIIGDYFSIWETRIILSKLRDSHSLIQMVALWVVDVIASILIFYVFFYFAQIAMVVPYVAIGSESANMLYDTILDIYSPRDFFRILVALLTFPESVGVIYSFCLFTTLSTTVWAGLAIAIVKAWPLLRRVGCVSRCRRISI